MTLQKKSFYSQMFCQSMNNEGICSVDEACDLYVCLIINKPLGDMCVCDRNIRDTRTLNVIDSSPHLFAQ